MEINCSKNVEEIIRFVNLMSKSLKEKYQFLVGKYSGTIVEYSLTKTSASYKGKIKSVDILITSDQMNIGYDFFINYTDSDGEGHYLRTANTTTLIIGDSEEEVKLEMELKNS